MSWLSVVALVSLQGCGRATSPEYKKGTGREVSILYLKSLCRGAVYEIAEDLWIEGVVVGNDAFGEFPNVLVVTDEYGGIELSIDRTALYREFEIGCTVRVYCNGLALGDYGGKVQLGLPPTGDYAVDRISEELLGRYVQRTEAEAMEPAAAMLTLREASMGAVSTFVRFDRLRFAGEEVGLSLCDRDVETGRLVASNRHLVDERGDTLLMRVAATCLYAEEPAPEGVGTFRGVLDYFNGEFQLRVVNREMMLSL